MFSCMIHSTNIPNCIISGTRCKPNHGPRNGKSAIAFCTVDDFLGELTAVL